MRCMRESTNVQIGESARALARVFQHVHTRECASPNKRDNPHTWRASCSPGAREKKTMQMLGSLEPQVIDPGSVSSITFRWCLACLCLSFLLFLSRMISLSLSCFRSLSSFSLFRTLLFLSCSCLSPCSVFLSIFLSSMYFSFACASSVYPCSLTLPLSVPMCLVLFVLDPSLLTLTMYVEIFNIHTVLFAVRAVLVYNSRRYLFLLTTAKTLFFVVCPLTLTLSSSPFVLACLSSFFSLLVALRSPSLPVLAWRYPMKHFAPSLQLLCVHSHTGQSAKAQKKP